MRNVFLLVAVFLMGIPTQAKTTNSDENVSFDPGTRIRYNATQTISFIEEGVLYKVATDGTFDFELLYRGNRKHRPVGYNYNYGRRGDRYNRSNRSYRGNRGGRLPKITRDHYGNIVGIGHTCITYKRNGKIRQIGDVSLRYHRGLLIQIGGLDIFYNRRGKISDMIGYINNYNTQTYVDGVAWNNDYWGDYGDDFCTIDHDHSIHSNYNHYRRDRIRKTK